IDYTSTISCPRSSNDLHLPTPPFQSTQPYAKIKIVIVIRGRPTMNIGIIGAGAIVNFLLKEINQNEAPNLQVKSVFVRNREKYQSLEEEFSINLYTDINDFINSDIDIVV